MEPDGTDTGNDGTFSGLYSVAESDYALSALEKIFGGIIPYVAGQDDAYNNIGTWLTPFIGTMNMIMLCIAVLVGTFTFLSLTAETVTDGQLLGRSTDTKNTFMRAGAAAIMFIPISGGFSVVQLLAFGVAVSGSGIANEAWNRYAAATLDSTVYTAPVSTLSHGDWSMRGQMAEATYTMIMGRLCQLHLGRLSDVYNVDASATRMAVPKTSNANNSSWLGSVTTSQTKGYEWYYVTGSGADASNDICGAVQYSITYNTVPDGTSTTLNSFSSRLKTLAQGQVFNSVISAIETVVQPGAEALADRIYSGTPSATTQSLRNDAVVQGEIKKIANTAALQIYNARSSIVSNPEEMQLIQEEMLEAVTKNGWIMAPVWQRSMAQLYVSVRELQTNLDLRISAQHNIGKIFGTGVYGFFAAKNQISEASFAPIERDMDYLQSHLVFVVHKMSLPDAESRNTNPLGDDAGAEQGGQSMRAFYNFFINHMGPNSSGGAVFKDPFMEYAEIGSNLFLIGAPLVAIGGIGEGLAALINADKLAAVVTGPMKSMGYYILALGVAYMLFIPTLPIIFFISGFISWALLVVEAVFALPLALLMWLMPAREPSMIGPWNKVMVTLCGLLLRPFLMISGLIACILMLWVGNEVLAIIFRNLLEAMTPDWNVMAVAMLLGLIGLYCYATVLLALHCCSLINVFGDAVMGWIGAIASPLQKESMGNQLTNSTSQLVPIPGIGAATAGLGNVAGATRQANKIRQERKDRKGGAAQLGNGSKK